MDSIRLLWLLSIWYFKSTFSLSQLYYNTSNRRGVPKQLFRRYEGLTYKLAKKSLDKKFFLTCLDLELCPEFLKFRAPRLPAYKNVKPLYQQAVRQQLEVIDGEILCIRNEWTEIRKKLYSMLGLLEKRCLQTLLQEYVDKKIRKDKERINAKLRRLWNRSKLRSPDCLINLSGKDLGLYEENVLYLGLNHHVLPKQVNDADVKVQVEKLFKSIEKEDSDKKLSFESKDEVKVEIQSFLKNVRRICSSKTNRIFHNSIRKLSDDDSIVVCKFDKGNGVVLLNKDDYNQKCYEILSDSSKFKKLNSDYMVDTILKKRRSLQNYVYRYLYKHEDIDEATYNNLYDVGCSPGKFYGLVKVHKDSYPIRPVVSMIDTPEYVLAKWLDSYIKPNIPSGFMLNSTEQFVSAVKDFPVCSDDKLVSFDVKSLYTNIPLKETIGIVADYLYSEDAVCSPPLPKNIFKKILTLVTEGFFVFNGEFYKQVDGLAMGGPLGPTLANFFLANLEKHKMFAICPHQHRPKLYLRYIDDVFAIFDKSQSYTPFFDFINALHRNLEFTVEVATNSLPFLDVNVRLGTDGVKLTVYRKPTNTNVILNFHAIAPTQWKAGLIFCMLHRAWKVCSSMTLFNAEVSTLRDIFGENGYPTVFFNRVVHKFEKLIRAPVHDNDDSAIADEDVERRFIIKLPFVNKASQLFAKRLKMLIHKKLGVKINIVYKSCKLSSFFSLKDKTPLALTSKCVYKFSCLRDVNVTYIGETTRPLAVRVDEHLASTKKTAVRKHIDACPTCSAHDFSLKDFQIIKRCRTNADTRVHEALLIKKHAPVINKQMFLSGASFVLTVY